MKRRRKNNGKACEHEAGNRQRLLGASLTSSRPDLFDAVWKSTSELGCRVDGVGRPKFFFHAGSTCAATCGRTASSHRAIILVSRRKRGQSSRRRGEMSCNTRQSQRASLRPRTTQRGRASPPRAASSRKCVLVSTPSTRRRRSYIL